MNLSNKEKGELIYKDIKNSYVFWSIKKSIKDEIIRYKQTRTQDIYEMIPKLLKELNLETKIKNKVHEILDKNGYFRETSQITSTKFKNCKNMSKLPGFFFDKEHEPLEQIAEVKNSWNDYLKNKLIMAVRTRRKPFMLAKK
jgi:phosphatidate phosphatase PAH1